MIELQYYEWSFTIFGKTYTSKDGVINAISITQSAKKKYSTANIQLSTFGNSLIEAIITKSKKDKGIKLPKSLAEESEQNNKAVASTSTDGALPGLNLLTNPGNVQRLSAFLDLTAYCEGTFKNGQRLYNIIVGGKTFSDFSDHPGIKNPSLYRQTGLNSDASGVSQFLSTTWRKSQPQDNPGVIDRMESAGIKIKSKGFSPEAQNAATAYHMKELSTSGWNAIQNGQVIVAMQAYRNTWESFDRMLNGSYGITTSQAVDFYNQRLKVYQSNSNRTTGTSTTSSQTTKPNEPKEVVKSPEQIAKEFNPDVSSCTVKAYLEVMAQYAFDTAKLGNSADTININNGSIVDQSKPIGRYKIPPSLWSTVYNNDGYDRNGQNKVFLKILKLKGAYEKVISGSIESVNRDLFFSFPDIPRSGDSRYNLLLSAFSKLKDDCVKVSPNQAKKSETVSEEEGGETIRITIKSRARVFNFDFFFISLTDSTISCKSVDAALSSTKRSAQFEGINEIELAAILLRRNGFNLKLYNEYNPTEILETKNFAITNKTDKSTLEKLYRDTGIKFNPVSLQDYEASKEDSLPLQRLVITDFFSSSFSVSAVAPDNKDPVDYPVTISVLTTDSILALKPRQTLSLLSPYNLVPEALRFDEWLLETITHDLRENKSTLILTKFIRPETEEKDSEDKKANSSTSSTRGDGKWSSPYPDGQFVVTSEFNPARVNPVSGTVRPHRGIDLAFTGSGTAFIKCTRDGKVLDVTNGGGYGNYVVVKHDNGFETLHAHCSRVLVKVGETVKRGQNIAIEGATGNVTGAHDHYEITRNGIAENPRLYHTNFPK
jgi:muramidase (phage lysozyme)